MTLSDLRSISTSTQVVGPRCNCAEDVQWKEILWGYLTRSGRLLRVTSAAQALSARSKPKKGPCLMLNLKVGDTIEPFFYGDYWIEEGWYCENCQQRMPEDERWQHSQTAFIHCVNGLIVEVTSIKPPERKMPDWPLIHQLSRDRLRYREALSRIRNSVWDSEEERKERRRSNRLSSTSDQKQSTSYWTKL